LKEGQMGDLSKFYDENLLGKKKKKILKENIKKLTKK